MTEKEEVVTESASPSVSLTLIEENDEIEKEIDIESEEYSLEESEYSYKLNSTCNLKYIINDDGKTVTITGYTGYSYNGLEIPGNIDGYTVTGIAYWRFGGNNRL